MNIQVSGASAHQAGYIDAFLQRHVDITGQYQMLISVHNFRHASVEGFELRTQRQENIVTVEIGVTLDRAVRYALNAVLDWLRLDSQQPLELTDGPHFPIRGVVEGFYGKPWSHAQRLKGIEFFADFGMNTYFLAPKDDPLQRFNWRSPFGVEFLVTAKELIERGNVHGVDFVACVSPGLSVQYSDQGDVDAVVTRFKQLMELGAVHFGLLWDDIAWELQHPEDIARYATTAQAHADFTNKVWNAISADNNKVQLTVCPMQYSGRGNEPYLVDLGRELKSRINLMWTGRQICSEYLDVSDAVIFERSALRPALYWDNFPVNDGSLQKSLFIGPLRGREKGLHKYSAGLLSNPMLQFEASLLPLATIGDYLWNTERYDAEISWEKNLIKLYPSDSARICAVLRNASDIGIAYGLAQIHPELLEHERERELIGALAEFPRVVAGAAELREPHRIARYAEELAGIYHRFYADCRVLPLGDEAPSALHSARATLCKATAGVIANSLALLGVTAPEKM